MTTSTTIRGPLLWCLFSAASLFGQHEIDCGGLNQRKCTWKDWEHYNMRYWVVASCDYDLKNSDGVCVNEMRTTKPRRRDWSAWAIREQIQSIGGGEPINYLTWPGSHNAYSSKAQGITDQIYSNQGLSVTDQLNYGVRHLEIDPHYYGPSGRNDIRLCHASSTHLCNLSGWQTRLFGHLAMEINDWLAANPGEILVIKLDDKMTHPIDGDSGFVKLETLLRRHLGDRLMLTPATGTFQRFPTPAEIRAAGKQVLVMLHNSGPEYSRFIWDSKGLVLSDNHPKSQNFDTCTDSAGKTPLTRDIKHWWDTAEGRSLSNFGDLVTSNTGLFRPRASTITFSSDRRVADAAACGVSIIGLDFVNSLTQGYYSDSNLDTRIEEAVWSWKEGDFGAQGPASLESASGRWASRPQTESKPFACALRRTSPGLPVDRQWRITAEARPWSAIVGNQLCAQEFGSQYEFAHPFHAFQNRQLKNLASRDVWLNYSVVPTRDLLLSDPYPVFTMRRAGNLPAAISISAIGAAGMLVKRGANLPDWLSVTPESLVLPASGAANFEVSLRPAAQALAAGLHQATLNFGGDLSGFPTASASMRISVNVQEPAVTTLTGPARVNWGQNFTLSSTVTVPGVSRPQGEVQLLQAIPSPGGGFTTEFLDVAYLLGNPQVQFTRSARLNPGLYTFAANYLGTIGAQGSESEPFTIEVLPRQSSPSALQFRMLQGGPPPVTQSVSLPGLGVPNSYEISGPCKWIAVDTVSQGAKISLTAAVSQLAPGDYGCPVFFRDAQSASGGYFSVPVNLQVTTVLTTSPRELTMVAAPGVPAQKTFAVSAGNDALVPVSFTSTAAWLRAFPGQVNMTTPMPAAIAAVDATGLPPGTYTGSIRIGSPLAEKQAEVRVTLRAVAPTTVNTSPAGVPIVVDGVTHRDPQTFAWEPGTQHSLLAPATDAASPLTRRRFSAWRIGATPNAHAALAYTAVSSGAALTALFTEEYRLSVSLIGEAGGSVQLSPPSEDGFYAANSTVQLKAVPLPGFQFAGWTGDLSGNQPETAVVMSGPRQVNAIFVKQAGVPVTFTSPSRVGSVTVNGVQYKLPVTLTFTPGEFLTITAHDPFPLSPNSRTVFQSWSIGGPRTQGYVVPPQAATLTVNYQTQHLVAVAASPLIGGTVTGPGWYNAGSQAEIRAVANSGFIFSGFGGQITGTANPATLAVNGPFIATANFAPAGRPTLVVSTAPPRAASAPDRVSVPLMIQAAGAIPAVDVRIVSISAIAVVDGTGPVTPAAAMPVLFGDLVAGGKAIREVEFNWPATARRVRFTVNYTSSTGQFAGAQTLTIFR